MSSIVYGRTQSDEELQEILELQQRNLRSTLSKTEIHKEGFVSVEHSFEVLKRMSLLCPHVIAKSEGKVIGYALCMLNSSRDDVPSLKPMFDYMDSISIEKGLVDLNYLIMGQVCIDMRYRKQGVFRGLYNYFKAELEHEYDAVITEVSSKNRRSSEAHKAIGFQCLEKHSENGENWELIIWKWSS